MKKSLRIRLIAFLLAFVMTIGFLPVSGFAAENDASEIIDEVAEETSETTEAPTEAPSELPTEAPTEAPSELPTEAPTEAPGEIPAEAPTEESTIPEDVVLFAVNGFVSETHDVFSSTESTIAPGVTQSINYAYSKDNKQMVYYVLTADVTRDDVVVQTSYKDQYVNQEFGMEKLTAQMAFADELYTDETSDRFISEYYKAVGGVNASFYNMTTGQPSGVTYLDGVQIGESSSYAQFFAILKDGSAIIDYTSNLANYEGNIWQACAGSQMLVWNGEDITANINGSYNTDRHSRTCVGVTADGKVVLMSLDGRQEPFSCGGTMHELAQIMLEQGCVAAINLDGGGSTTFAARQEGENEVTIVNRPSDGSERSISSGLIIGSLAAPSDVFDRATLTAEEEYVTPGSTVTVIAKGVSPAGTAADIPEGVTWQLADSSLGTVEDGVFVSSGVVGDAVVQMVYEGNVVGSTIIHVVVPETITFDSASITVPYGKSVTLEMTATYGLNEVVMKDGDVVFTLAESAVGTISGFTFTAAAEGTDVASSAITAALAFDESVTASSEIKLGKGSEVIYDFEDGTTGGFYTADDAYNYVWPEAGTSVVTAENGQVHSGDYALQLNINYSNSQESGYQRNCLRVTEGWEMQNAVRLGMWIYIPEEAVGLWARWQVSPVTARNEDGTVATYGSTLTGEIIDGTITGKTGYVSSFEESGWHYLSIDLSAYPDVAVQDGFPIMQFYVSDRDGADFGYDASNYSNITGDFTFYIDDITIDYSEAVDDREAPVFSSVVYADEFTNDAPELNGQTTTSNTLSFTATVADYVKDNASGLDAATAKAYIDGVEVPFTYSNGKLAIEDAVLADGLHTVKFSICDQMGNYGSVIRQITVNAGSGMDTVKLVPHDGTLDRILHGSVYYMDLMASAIENVKSVSTTIDLDSLSTWELDHMDVADGFEASYTIREDENIATVTITRTGDVDASGEAVLASIPVRVWQLKTGYVYENGTKAGNQAYTAKQFRDMKEFWRISLIATVDCGILTTMDGSVVTFTGERVFVDTESWAEDSDMIATEEGTAYYNSWDGGHVHTAEALEDKAPTCTENGYTGRTFCDGCNSVVEWGATIPATGHTYTEVDGKLTCACGKLLSGELDGKHYADGVAMNGWVENAYYVDGIALTGVAAVDGVYYNFGTDGISQGKYTGFFTEGGKIYYAIFGSLASGWYQVGDDYYYFNTATHEALVGEHVLMLDQPITYTFGEDGALVSGVWMGTRYYYGPAYYWQGWQEIDGETYFFEKGYCYTGCRFVIESNSTIAQWYDFGENGALVEMINTTGLFEANGNIYYLIDGQSQYGMYEIDGYYYYFRSSTRAAVVSDSYYCTNMNGCGLAVDTYEFDEQGRMIRLNGIVEEDGVMYYYVDGVKTYAGLILIDGDYYYVNSKFIVVTGSYNVWKTNDLLPQGLYEFGEDGKMLNPPATDDTGALRNGIVTENGVMYYYVNGYKNYAGLIQIDGDYYYVNSKCVVVTGSYTIWKTNGLMEAGTYFFGEDGKMVMPEDVKNGIVEEDGVMYYYVDGVKTYAGLIEIDGDYYYVNSKCIVVTGSYTIWKTNGLMEAGTYFFGEDGKMVMPEDVKNGLVEEDGALYYYVDGVKTYAGLIIIDGDYYYINSSCKAVTGTYYVWKTNGLLPQDYYEFGTDGKMIDPPAIDDTGAVLNGIVTEDGVMYYYENGVKTYAGLIIIDGDYYYVNSKFIVVTGTYTIWKTNDLLPQGTYEFGTDGKMITE